MSGLSQEILPMFKRQTEAVRALIPELYLRAGQ
jgi:hypothetical protein